MIPRRRRLQRARFEGVRTGVRAASPSFSISFKLSETAGCAAVVSKAVAKRAVARHLLKRRMLSVMRPWAEGRYSFIVYARGPAATLPFRELASELTSLLSRTLR